MKNYAILLTFFLASLPFLGFSQAVDSRDLNNDQFVNYDVQLASLDWHYDGDKLYLSKDDKKDGWGEPYWRLKWREGDDPAYPRFQGESNAEYESESISNEWMQEYHAAKVPVKLDKAFKVSSGPNQKWDTRVGFKYITWINFDKSVNNWRRFDRYAFELDEAVHCHNVDFQAASGKPAKKQTGGFVYEGEWPGDDVNKIKTTTEFTTVWRYTNGTKSSPLDFGVIEAGASPKTHINANRRAPYSYPENLGYSNDWDWQDGSDVTYKFEIRGTAKKVRIHKNFPETASYPYSWLGLYNSQEERLGQAFYNHTVITKDLCPGIYYIVVDSRYTQGTDFKISISAEESTLEAGMITARYFEVCDETEIPRIFGKDLSPYSPAGPLEFFWETCKGTCRQPKDWDEIIGENQAILENPGTMTMDGDVTHFRRGVRDCGGNVKKSNTISFFPKASTVTPGNIQLEGNTSIRKGTSPGKLISQQAATASPGQPHYSWQKCEKDDCDDPDDWDPILNNANGSSYQVPVLEKTVSYRRVASNECGKKRYSDPVRIEVIEPKGYIGGTVLSENNSPVSGVHITAKLISHDVPGAEFGEEYTATTNEEGKFDIDKIYFGPSDALFEIKPYRVDPDGKVHKFRPASTTRKLQSSRYNISDVKFIDTTVLTIEGRITQQIGSFSCPMDSVELQLFRDGMEISTGQKTDKDGCYQLTVSDPGASYTVRPVFKNHRFSTTKVWPQKVEGNLSGQDFTDQTQFTVKGHVTGNCNVSVGQALVRVWVEGGCLDTTVATTQEGRYELQLPAREYAIQVKTKIDSVSGMEAPEYMTREIAETFTIRDIDLVTDNDTMDFIYHPAPTVEVTGLPELADCEDYDNGYPYPVLEQGQSYALEINVWEGNKSYECPVDTGRLIITDEISDRQDTEHIVYFSKGKAKYEMLAGFPNTVESQEYLKNLSITVIVMDAQGNDAGEGHYNQKALVTGSQATETTFTTVSPQIPLMILRDPPGDGSYSYLEKSTTFDMATRIYTQEDDQTDTWANVRVGTEFELDVFGFSTETKIWADASTSRQVSAVKTEEKEMVFSVTHADRIATSSECDLMGEEADVFIGGALNLLFAAAERISFSNCGPVKDTTLIVGSDGFKTTYRYHASHIKNTVLPDLRFLQAMTPNQDSVIYYQDQINAWEQILQYNEDLKKDAKVYPEQLFTEDELNGNNSLSANVHWERSTTIESSETIAFDFSTAIEDEIAAALGLEIAGSGGSGGVLKKMRIELGGSTSETKLKSLKTGFEIYDNDNGDFFSATIKQDPVYKTPIFDLEAATTSCPYEPGTKRRDLMQLTVDRPVQTGIPADGEAEFVFRLANISQTVSDLDTERPYKISFDDDSNKGVRVTIGGDSHPDVLNIPRGEEREVIVKVSRNRANEYSFEGLEFIMTPVCDGDCGGNLEEKVLVSAFFESPCSDITLAEPGDNWIVDQTSGDQILLEIRDYTKDNMQELTLEYTRAGRSAWKTGKLIKKEDLSDSRSGTHIPWDVSGLPDDAYELRLKLKCEEAIIYTPRVRGVIDRGEEEVQEEYTITFQVDLNAAGPSPDGVFLAGDFQMLAGYPHNWDPTTIRLEDPDQDGIYSTTVTLSEGQADQVFSYKFINGSQWEDVSMECGLDDGNGFFNRSLQLPADGSTSVEVQHCFSTCETACSALPESEETAYDITFDVDLSAVGAAPEGVFLAGDFQQAAGYPHNWDPTSIQLDDSDGDDVYSVTITLYGIQPGDVFGYKFINGSQWEDVPAECGLDYGDIYNRGFEVPDDEPFLELSHCFAACGSSCSLMNQPENNGQGIKFKSNVESSSDRPGSTKTDPAQLEKAGYRHYFPEQVSVGGLEYGVEAELGQNYPNPVRHQTTIPYRVPRSAAAVQLLFSSVEGRVIRSFSIEERGEGKVVFDSGLVSEGMLFYSLIVDGNRVGTKKMVITRK